jgi:hypothetical protein
MKVNIKIQINQIHVEKFSLEEKLLPMDILVKQRKKKMKVSKKLMKEDIFVQEILEKFFPIEPFKLLVTTIFFFFL